MASRANHVGGLAQDLFLAVAGDFAEGPVDGHDMPSRVGDHPPFAGVFEHGGRQAQLFLALATGGDVLVDAEHAEDLALRVA